MMIKTTRIRTVSGADAVCDHVFRGAENEKITILQGDEEQIKDAFCVSSGMYAVRHISISPQKKMTREEAAEAFSEWSTEFGAGDRPMVIIEHKKQRADGQSSDVHYHGLVWEQSPENTGVLSSSHMYRRNEKVARVLEMRFGHRIQKGRHNRAVYNSLKKEGHLEEAQRLIDSKIVYGTPANSSFSPVQAQIAKRNGISLSKVRHHVMTSFDQSKGGDDFLKRLKKSGFSFKKGEKDGFVILIHSGKEVGALHRHLQMRPTAVTSFLKTKAPAAPAPTPAPTPKPVAGRETTRKNGEDYVDQNGVVHVAEELYDQQEHEKQLREKVPVYKPKF